MEWMDKIIELDTEDPGNWYDKSCLYARMNRCDDAVAALETAFQKGYRSFPHIQHDDDMDPIRDREDFKALILKYEKVLEEELSKVGKEVESTETKVVSEVDMKKMYSITKFYFLKSQYGTFMNVTACRHIVTLTFDVTARQISVLQHEVRFDRRYRHISSSCIKDHLQWKSIDRTCNFVGA